MASVEETVGLPEVEPANWRIVVDSIGEADASLIKALKKITPVPETHLASLIYRAPSQLMDGLGRHTAEALNKLLVEAGLESRVVDAETSFEPGDDAYELALVVRDIRRMNEVMTLVVRVLGVGPPTARKILCTSPTVLLGKVSANTAEALRRRFEPFDVDVVASRSDEALFDLFLGACSISECHLAVRTLREEGIEVAEAEARDQPLLAAGLSKEQTDRVWQRLQRTSVPLRVINRDFETFDVRLTRAPETPEMVELLTTTTGMPESVACKVLRNLPVVIYPGVGFSRMSACLSEVARRGGEATAELLAFQAFGLEIQKVGDLKDSSQILQALAGLAPEEAYMALRRTRRVEGPLTPPQARWLRHALHGVGTRAELSLL